MSDDALLEFENDSLRVVARRGDTVACIAGTSEPAAWGEVAPEEYSAPLRSDEDAMRDLPYPSLPDRTRQIRVFAEAYGFESTEGRHDAVLEERLPTRRSIVALAERGPEPQQMSVGSGLLDAQDARIAWTRADRALFP